MRVLVVDSHQRFGSIQKYFLENNQLNNFLLDHEIDANGLADTESINHDVIICGNGYLTDQIVNYCARCHSKSASPILVSFGSDYDKDILSKLVKLRTILIIADSEIATLPGLLKDICTASDESLVTNDCSSNTPSSPVQQSDSGMPNEQTSDSLALEDTIRKLEEAQNQLLQSEKLASIGQLAAGVAHEINNPIGYVYSNLTALASYLDDLFSLLNNYENCEINLPAPVQEQVRGLKQQIGLDFLRQDVPALFNESKEGLERVKKIVIDLRDFSRTGADEEWQWADVRNCINSTLNIVMNDLKYKATVDLRLDEIPEIYCLPSQLNQVLMNVLVNAGHSIEVQGSITITTKTEGQGILVEIQDTGRGISSEIMSKIFDPFFTTKPVGQGTGLGLALSYGIVQKHSGRIDVRSTVGEGTTFGIWLPRDQPHRKDPTPSDNPE